MRSNVRPQFVWVQYFFSNWSQFFLGRTSHPREISHSGQIRSLERKLWMPGNNSKYWLQMYVWPSDQCRKFDLLRCLREFATQNGEINLANKGIKYPSSMSLPLPIFDKTKPMQTIQVCKSISLIKCAHSEARHNFRRISAHFAHGIKSGLLHK